MPGNLFDALWTKAFSDRDVLRMNSAGFSARANAAGLSVSCVLDGLAIVVGSNLYYFAHFV
jgi:hypothetical protein